MTRSDLVEELAAKFGQITQRDAEFAVKAILEAMNDALARGHRIEIRGFGSFSVNYRPPRMGRNPRSGESVAIPEKKVPHFKPGKALRLAVAERHLRPGGTVSGPSLFALADVAMYLAILSRIGPVALAVTTNCSIDFMRKPAAGRDVLAQARVLKLGRSLAVGDVLLFSEGGTEPVARAGLTYSIPPQQG